MRIKKLFEDENFNEPYDYDDIDSDSYIADDEDYFDSYEVKQGNDFTEGGEEYTWFRPESEIYHMDFDNWQVWSAMHHLYDTYGTEDEHDELVYFIVDVDTGFIDWGPEDSKINAQEWLEGKYQDYLYLD